MTLYLASGQANPLFSFSFLIRTIQVELTIQSKFA